jgi:multiple sugar transport system permease protein
LMEAARLDGAGSVKTFFAVKLPLMKHTILITLIMSSAAAVNMLAIVKGLTEGGPGRSTEVLALTLYNQSFEFISPGFGASIAMFLLFVNICLTIGYIFILRIRGELIQ